MTVKEFIAKYDLNRYVDYLAMGEEALDSRYVIRIATSSLSDVQEHMRFDTAIANSRINDIKEFLFDWDRVLKTQERIAFANSKK